MPKVSVVLPVYNVENYLKECLDSLVEQTYKDIEIICVDDGSSDSSLKILKEYAVIDNRIIVLEQKNQGAAVARNFGLSVATGEYVSFLDSDDVFSLNLFQMVMDQARIYNSDIIIFKAVSFDDNSNEKAVMNDNISHFYKIFDNGFSCMDIPNEIFNSFLVPAWNKVFKRRFLIENGLKFQNIKRCNDLYFSNVSLVLASNIVLIDEVLLFYRVGMNSNLQSGNDKTPLEFYKAIEALKHFLDEEKIYMSFKKSFICLALDVIFYNITSVKTVYARNLIISKFRNEGFKVLGIDTVEEIKQTSLMRYLQCKYILKSENKMIVKFLYGLHKMIEYYRFTGLKNTIRKVLLRC